MSTPNRTDLLELDNYRAPTTVDANDASDRFSLLELDIPSTVVESPSREHRDEKSNETSTVPAVDSAPEPTRTRPRADGSCSCPVQSRPLGIRGVCPDCNGSRAVGANFGRINRPDVVANVVSARVETSEVVSALIRGDLVAGAAADGHGVLVGWSGSGELTRSSLSTLLTAAGAADWIPMARSAHSHAAKAVASLGSSYTVRASKVPSHRDEDGKVRAKTVEERGWSARWAVGRVAGEGEVGDAYGRIAIVVSLAEDGTTLILHGPDELKAVVAAEYDRLVADEIYSASSITNWLKDRLRNIGAVKLGGSWYVPTVSREKVESIVAALSEAWGRDWYSPPLPVATSAQLCSGLAKGLTDEVDDVLSDFARDRTNAKAAGREDLGSRGAATLVTRLAEVAERAKSYAALLGDDLTAGIRSRIRAAQIELSPLVDAVTLRGIALELD